MWATLTWTKMSAWPWKVNRCLFLMLWACVRCCLWGTTNDLIKDGELDNFLREFNCVNQVFMSYDKTMWFSVIIFFKKQPDFLTLKRKRFHEWWHHFFPLFSWVSSQRQNNDQKSSCLDNDVIASNQVALCHLSEPSMLALYLGLQYKLPLCNYTLYTLSFYLALRLGQATLRALFSCSLKVWHEARCKSTSGRTRPSLGIFVELCKLVQCGTFKKRAFVLLWGWTQPTWFATFCGGSPHSL